MNRAMRRNPVAKAVAKKKLHDAIRDQKIQLYMLDKGEKCEALMTGIAMTLSLMAYAGALDPTVGRDNPKVRVVEGGMSACLQMSEANAWDPIHTVALDVALDAAEYLSNHVVKDEFVTKAFHGLTTASI